MNIETDSDNNNNPILDDFLLCQYDSDRHYYSDAKILPCGNSACLNCIKKSLRDNILNCRFCNKRHDITRPDDLLNNNNIRRNLDKYAREVLIRTIKQVNVNIDDIKTHDESFKNLFENITSSIEKRVDCIINKLHNIKQKLLNELNEIKINFKMPSSIDVSINEIEELSDQINTKAHMNKLNMYEIQSNLKIFEKHLESVKNYNSKFYDKLSRIKFNASTWLPEETMVGTLYGRGAFEIKVKLMSGKMESINVTKNETIKDIKERIVSLHKEEFKEYAIEDLTIKYKSFELDDNTTLEHNMIDQDYEIEVTQSDCIIVK